MPRANIHSRRSLEQAYPPDAFASDAAQNGRVASEVVRGLRILSAPNPSGEFDLERATRQVGEAASAAFLAPSRAGGTLEESAAPNPPEGYEAFLDELVAAAQRFGFKPEESPGPDDPRIRGLRQ